MCTESIGFTFRTHFFYFYDYDVILLSGKLETQKLNLGAVTAPHSHPLTPQKVGVGSKGFNCILRTAGRSSSCSLILNWSIATYLIVVGRRSGLVGMGWEGGGGAGGAGCERFDGVINNGVGGEDVTKRGNG